jgi:hypothetical protein
MSNSLIEKLKYLLKRILFHGKKFVKDVDETFKERINTSEKAKNLLRTRASVKDLYDIINCLEPKKLTDNIPGSYMPTSEYTLYDDYGFKLYYFNGEKNDFLSDEELLKVSKVINSYGKNKPNKVFAMRVYYKYQFYFLIKEGKNGSGDFVDDDMKNVVKYLDAMKEAGATWRTVTDLNNDIVDDVSTWAITFTID